MIQLEEDKKFLEAQREDGRQGAMISKDMSLANKEARRNKREEEKGIRADKALKERENMEETIQLSSSSSSSRPNSPIRVQRVHDGAASTSPLTESPHKRHRASKKIMNSELSAAMDRTKVSDRDGVYLLTAAARSLGYDPCELVINRESFRRDRQKLRAAAAAEIKDAFKPSVPLTVHWDGKILPSADAAPAIDRLPVLVSGDGVEKLLAIPSLPNGTGRAAANAILTTLYD